jgi:ABC-2 type transport system ATP-binding protein
MGLPVMMVLDEPVSGLDPIGIREVRKILVDLRKCGITIILNSHLLSEVEKTCDTAAIIHNGRIVVKGSIDSIVTQEENLEDVFVKYVSKE